MAPSRQVPKRIVIVTSGLGAGGAEKVIAQLAEHWSSAGHQVEIVTFDRPGDAIFHPLPDTVSLHRLGVDGVARRIISLRAVLSRRRPDVVVSFLTKINLICALACLGTRIRLVCSERNNPERQGAHPLWNIVLGAGYRRANTIVCQTQAVHRCFAPALRGRLVTIPNPVPAAGLRPDAGGKRICAVGRLTHQKGFDILLQAFAAIAWARPGWSLDIWGDGPDRAALEARIEALGLVGRAHLRGLSPKPRSWVRDADIFALSSRYEGFPNVLGEAMAAGIAVAAVNCDFGPADMIEHGRSGLLTPYGDISALSAALETLMVDPELRKRLGRHARESMERFRPDRVLRLWDSVLVGAGQARATTSAAAVPAILEGR